MLESGQKWDLFGYDMRNVGRHWLDAWRDLLWVYDSPVRRRLDDAVCLRSEGGEAFYQAGQPSTVNTAEYSAILLPDALVLSRVLDLPAAVEGELSAVLALEVNAHSPFSPDDTSYGWRIARRDESQIKVVLVIISKSSAMAYLGREFGIHDSRQQEVWAKVDGEMTVIQGFGEDQRERSYTRRLLRVTVMLGVIALLLLSLVGAATGLKALELKSVEEMAEMTDAESQEASRMRSSLGLANEIIASVNEISMTYPNPQVEISRLTHLLNDGEYIEQFSMDGLDMEMRGGAADAASVMKRLTDQPDYAEVNAPRAFTRLRGTDIEQFYLNVRLNEGSLP